MSNGDLVLVILGILFFIFSGIGLPKAREGFIVITWGWLGAALIAIALLF